MSGMINGKSLSSVELNFYLFTMQETLETFPQWLFILLMTVAIWESVWKAMALYRAGNLRQPAWFIVLFVVNTAGILPIMYYFYFSKKYDTVQPVE